MSKKTIAEIVVIVAALVGSAVVLMRGLSDDAGVVAVVQPGSVTTTADPVQVLPFGDSFDPAAVLARYKLQFGVVEYPKVDATDVGQLPADLFNVKTATGTPGSR